MCWSETAVGYMWVLLGVGIVFVFVVFVAVFLTRDGSAAEPAADMSGDDLFSLGVVFTGAGVAMAITLGPFMIWMVALGVTYMALGTARKRHQ